MKLTKRQIEIMNLVRYSYSSKEIAYKLGIDDITVRNHMVNIFERLEVHSRLSAVIICLELGIIDGLVK